jgi:hypothetical protein
MAQRLCHRPQTMNPVYKLPINVWEGSIFRICSSMSQAHARSVLQRQHLYAWIDLRCP